MLVGGVAPASATSVCTGTDATYSSTSNAIHLVTAGKTYSLADILTICPGAPLAEVDTANDVWELRADLIVSNGATLTISASATGADRVAELRLQSLSDSVFTHVTQLAADYGTLNINGVHVRSWDDAKGTTDNDTTLAACPTGTKSSQCPRGRAFIRALSSLDADGTTWHESTMNITGGSEVDHLGYYAATSYGVSYKTEGGCDHLHQSLCGHVFGQEVDSNFHDNYMGTYTWGAQGIRFIHNAYFNNTMYGLDPHDVSNDLVIQNNHMSYNGDHGLICAEACANLTITGNESDHNGEVPWHGPAGDGTGSNVHGIMLYRGATNAVVTGNNVHDQPNGSGIAIFDTSNATVTGNTLTGNDDGIQVSVGSAGNQISGNSITDSTEYAVVMYRGGDAPHYTTSSGRPTDNIVNDNTITGTGSNGVKLTEADANVFSGDTFSGLGNSLYFAGSVGNVIKGGTLPSGQKVSSVASNGPSSTVITDPAVPVGVSVDSTSSTDMKGTKGTLFTASGRSLSTQSTPAGSVLHLTSSTLGSTGTVTVTPQPVTVLPAAGTATASATGSGTSTNVSVAQSSVSPVTITVAGFTGSTYSVLRDGTVIDTRTTLAGVISFTTTPPGTGTYHYTFRAATGATAPETTIASGPSGLVTANSATFTYTSSVTGSTFACSLDGAAAAACATAGVTYNGLTDGAHTFSVTATSSGVADPTPATRTWTVDSTKPTVSASPKGGTYSAAQTVTLTSSEAGSIFYTTNGSTPTAASTKYTAPVSISSNTTLKFIAVDTAGNPSDVGSELYTIQAVVPLTVSASPKGGTYSAAQTVTLTANKPGSIYYTTDGTAPTASSAKYTAPLSVSSTTTLRFLAFDTAGNSSAVVTELYTIQAAPPAMLFQDGFESGGLSNWTTNTGLVAQGAVKRDGSFAARATSTSGTAEYASKTLSSATNTLYYRTAVDIVSSSTTVYLARVRGATGTGILGVYVTSAGKLSTYNYVTGSSTVSTITVSKGTFHTIEVRLSINGASSSLTVLLDGAAVTGLGSSGAINLGTAAAGRVEIGESTTGRTFDVVFDTVQADNKPLS